MKILLTGGTGVIGQHLIPFLINQNHELCLIVREKSPIEERLSPKELTNCSFILWKELNEDLLIHFSPEAVFHLAGYSTSANDLKTLDKLISSNIILGSKLLHHLQGVNSLKYFINIGSASEYYNNTKSPDPTNLYAASKTAFRSFLSHYQNLLGIKTVHLVLYNVYGMASKNKRVMDYLLDGLDSKSPVDVSPGLQQLDFIHINDVLNFFDFLIQELSNLDQEENIIYLGTGVTHSLRKVASIIENISQKKLNLNWGGIPYRDRDVMNSRAPMEENEVSWEPSIIIEDGIRQYLNLII